jgi:hypothetical protein
MPPLLWQTRTQRVERSEKKSSGQTPSSKASRSLILGIGRTAKCAFVIYKHGPGNQESAPGGVVDANYLFERAHRFAGIQPNSGFGDYSCLSCGVGDTQLGAGFCRIAQSNQLRSQPTVRDVPERWANQCCDDRRPHRATSPGGYEIFLRSHQIPTRGGAAALLYFYFAADSLTISIISRETMPGNSVRCRRPWTSILRVPPLVPYRAGLGVVARLLGAFLPRMRGVRSPPCAACGGRAEAAS